MKTLLSSLVLMSAILAQAGTGEGEVTCSKTVGGKTYTATYSWFHSNADSYSEVQVSDGVNTASSGGEALATLSVRMGTKLIIVSPNLKKSSCSIRVK